MSEQELKDYYIQKAIERETEEINKILDEIKNDSAKNTTLYEELLHSHNMYPGRNNT
jgi:Txe/YoeB family toxin of Txe-Axe toxin-antitoxin module